MSEWTKKCNIFLSTLLKNMALKSFLNDLKFLDNIIKDTLIHEMLHTLQDTKGHDTKWKWYADRVNHNYVKWLYKPLSKMPFITLNSSKVIFPSLFSKFPFFK